MSQTSGKIPSQKREEHAWGALREPDKCEAVPPSEAAEGAQRSGGMRPEPGWGTECGGNGNTFDSLLWDLTALKFYIPQVADEPNSSFRFKQVPTEA